MSGRVFSETPLDILTNFENQIYSPQSEGLKKLKFEVRILNIKEKIGQALGRDDLKDVYVEVNWNKKDGYSFNVMGLGEGFKEIKDELIGQVYSRLEYVLPETLKSKLKELSLTDFENKEGVKKFKAIDPKYQGAVTEMRFVFNSNDLIEKMTIISIQGQVDSQFTYQKIEDKSILSKFESETTSGGYKTIVNQTISYVKVKKFTFPEKIEIKTNFNQIEGEKKKAEKLPEILTALEFTNYRAD